jgi:hypothetical protein
MFKYGISYYTVENGERKPESGVDVRLLRPGADWQTGIPLIETGDTGYYECFIEDEKDCGFYEIWDNRNDPIGSFSGKYCTIGKLDARGLQNDCIYGNHILDGVVTGSKIANESIGTEHLQNGLLSLSKLQYETQDQDKGVGDNSQASPAKLSDDKVITHVLDKEYQELPHIILTNQCDAFLYIADAKIEGNLVTIMIGISQVYTATDPFYKLLALAK